MMTDESDSFPFGKCRICTGKAMGVHYGTATCEGCKAFFKRWMDRDKTLSCYFGGDCVITPDTRHCCKGCRFRKCKENGMSIEAIKMGRIPKIEKKAAIEDLQRSRKTTIISSSVEHNSPKQKDVEKNVNENEVNQGTSQDNDNMSTLIPDRTNKEEHVLTNLQQKTGRSRRSPPEQRFFSKLDEIFGDRQTSLNVVKNGTLSLSRGNDEVIPSYDSHAQPQNTIRDHQQVGTSFPDHDNPSGLTEQTPRSDQINSTPSLCQSSLTPSVLSSHRLEFESGHNTMTTGAKYLPMNDTSQSLRSVSRESAFNNDFYRYQYPPVSHTDIPSKVMTSVAHPADEVTESEDHNTSGVDDFSNTHHRTTYHPGKHIDNDVMHGILSSTVDEPFSGIYDVTQAHKPDEFFQTGAPTSEVSEVGPGSAYLHNYVRLLSTLSENESPMTGLGNHFDSQNDSVGIQPSEHWQMDTSPAVSAISVDSPVRSDPVDSDIVFPDKPHVQTIYTPDSLYSNVENGLEKRDVVTGRGVPNGSQPEVENDSREFVNSNSSIDTVYSQQNSSLTSESLPSDPPTREAMSPNRHQNDQTRNSVQSKMLNQMRMSQLASAIFRSLNGNMGPSGNGAPINMRDLLLNHLSRTSNGTDKDGIGKARASSDTDQAGTDPVHTSNDTNQAETDEGVTDIMRKTIEVFQRSVDKLYIPIFLKRRITKKHKHSMKCLKITTRSQEGIGYFISKLFNEIKTENERVTGFALEIPGFTNLVTDDQMLLLKRAFIEIHLLTTSEFKANDESFYIEDNALVLNQSALNALVDARMVDQINRLSELFEKFGLSHLEIGLLCAIQLTSLDGVSVEDARSVEALHSHYLDVFSYMVYSSNRDNKARMVVEIFFNLIPVLKELSGSINRCMESVFLEQNAELLFKNLQ